MHTFTRAFERLAGSLLVGALIAACWVLTAPAAGAGECTITGASPMGVTCAQANIDTLNGPMSRVLTNDGDIGVTVTSAGQVVGAGLVVETSGTPHAIDIVNNGLIEADVGDPTSGALEIAGNGGAIRYSGSGVVRNLNSNGNGIFATNQAGGSIHLAIDGGVLGGQSYYAVAATSDYGAITVSTGAGLLVGGLGIVATTDGKISIENRAGIEAQYAGIVADACDCGTIHIDSYGDITVSDASGDGIVAYGASKTVINVLGGTIAANTGIVVVPAADASADILIAQGATITADDVAINGQIARSDITIAGTISGSTAAIYLGADDDTVTIHGTARIYGTVYAGIHADFDTLKLGGAVAGIFDLDELDPTTGQFVGFDDVRKAGTSTWTVVDTGGFYAGTIEIDQGRLRVDTPIPGLTANIGANGTLGGIGALGAFTADGTVAPGNSIGTLTVNDAVFNPGSTFAVEIDPAQSDQVKATNSVAIHGGTVAVSAMAGAYAPGQQYDILLLESPGLIDYLPGFSAVTINSGLLDPTWIAESDKVVLSITPVAIESRGRTPNQKATGRALDAFGTAAPHFAALFGLSAAQLPAALDMLSGEVHAATRTTLLDHAGVLRKTALDRLESVFDAVPVSEPLFYAADTSSPPEAGRHIWATGFGLTGAINGDGNAGAIQHGLGGLVAGIDGVIGLWRVGLMAGYGHGGLATRNARAEIDSGTVGLYAGTMLGDTRLSLGALYTGHALATSRTVALPGVTETLQASYGAGTAQVFARAAQHFDLGTYEIEPFAELAYLNLATGAFAETGGAAALSAPAGTMNALTATLGLGGKADMVLDGGILATFKASAGWRQTFADPALSQNAFMGGTAFTIAGPSPAGGALAVSAGLDLDFSAAARLSLTYDGQLAGAGHNHAFKASLAGRF